MKSTVPSVTRTKYVSHWRPRIYPVVILYIPLRLCSLARSMKVLDGKRLTFSEMLMQSLILHMRRVRLWNLPRATEQRTSVACSLLTDALGIAPHKQTITLGNVLNCNTELSEHRAEGSHLIITLFTKWFLRQRFITLLPPLKSSP